jgi:CBS domain-containing protein
MVVNRIRYCVIVNNAHEVLGIISARSILKAFGKDLDTLKAKDILLPYTITITPNSPLKDAIELMKKRKIEHLIVVSDKPASKAVFGILHAGDVVAKMANS